MQKLSLPFMLQLQLKQHADASDIEDDDELKVIMHNLAKLHEKVEAVKARARQNGIAKN